MTDPTRLRQIEVERANLNAACYHLALVAVDGATDEVARTLSPAFCCHLDGITTDRGGYFALIEAHRATYSPRRPPLDMRVATASGDIVTAELDSPALARFRLTQGLIAELWLTIDPNDSSPETGDRT